MNATDSTVKGFVTEDFHAGTFNADVAAKLGDTSKTFALVDKTNDPVVDINIHSNGRVIGIQSAEDIQDALKDLLGGTIKEMLEAEMDEHLGYDSYERPENSSYRICMMADCLNNCKDLKKRFFSEPLIDIQNFI